MKTEQELAEFYIKLKKRLEETTSFPTSYLYKFIVPNDVEKIAEFSRIFEKTDAQIKTRPSSNGKYMAVSVSVTLSDADAVIFYYKEAGKIDGILSL